MSRPGLSKRVPYEPLEAYLPFRKGAKEFLETHYFSLRDTESFISEILSDDSKRSAVVDRIVETIVGKYEPKRVGNESTVAFIAREIEKYYMSLIVLAAFEDKRLLNTFAVHEAKRVSKILESILVADRRSAVTEVVNIGRELGMRCEQSPDGYIKVHFIDYVRNAPRDPAWKLVNCPLEKGYVKLNAKKFVRLIEEAYKRFIVSKVEEFRSELSQLETFRELAKLKEDVEKRIKKVSPRRAASVGGKKIVVRSEEELHPPCIRKLLELAKAGENLSHFERFTLAAYLVNIGWEIDDIVKVFENVPDFDEKKTRYQIEHIAGLRGRGVRYLPPNCDNIRSFSPHLCTGCDLPVKNPLAYYRKKLRAFKGGSGGGGEEG